jgi:hypothetical protein
MNENLEYFTIVTLVDITNTGVTRNVPELEFERNQQRNWESVLQVISLRTQPMPIRAPYYDDIPSDIVDNIFGEMHHGRNQRVWVASFAVEHRDVFLKDDDQLALLKEDFNQVPVICGLTETAGFILPIFYSHGSLKNIAFISGLLGQKL